jgi:hypothetical protein
MDYFENSTDILPSPYFYFNYENHKCSQKDWKQHFRVDYPSLGGQIKIPLIYY